MDKCESQPLHNERYSWPKGWRRAVLPLVTSSLISGGCRAPDIEHGHLRVTASSDSLSLEVVRLSVASELLPSSNAFSVAVGDRGVVALVTDAAGEPIGRIVIVDTTGAVLARFARNGPGPGELSNPGMLAAVGGSLFVEDMPEQRVEIYSTQGRFLRSVFMDSGRLLGVTRDSIDVWHFLTGEVSRIPIQGTGGRVLLRPQQDSAFAALTAPVRGERQWPVFASRDSEFVLVDRFNYRLHFYADAGKMRTLDRSLPPRKRTPREISEDRQQLDRMVQRGMQGPGGRRIVPSYAVEKLARLETEDLPHVLTAENIGYDANGTLWVLGTSADSTFADAFRNQEFVRRFMLPCYHGFNTSIAGHWIALLCDTTSDTSDAAVELQLYRIRN